MDYKHKILNYQVTILIVSSLSPANFILAKIFQQIPWTLGIIFKSQGPFGLA